MTKPRVIETEQGLQGEFVATAYDTMMRQSRDKGQLLTHMIVEAGITTGLVLEIGPGPGYLGFEWLKQTQGTTLKAVDISLDMLTVAEKNAREDGGLANRVEFIHGDAMQLPFDGAYFDGVFTNATLHEWVDPEQVFNEIHRVLKPGGRYLVTDLRRDMPLPIKWLMWLGTQPKEIRPGLTQSINASFTQEEVRVLLAKTSLSDASVKQSLFGLAISGRKEK